METINLWLQTIAIVIAAVWAIYTFFYNHTYKPSKLEGSLSGNISLKDGGTKDSLHLINTEITIGNDSKQVIHAINGHYIVTGYKLIAEDKKKFIDSLNQIFEKPDVFHLSKYSTTESQIIGGGKILINYRFPIGTEITKNILLVSPKGKFDFISVSVVIPIIRKKFDLNITPLVDSAEYLSTEEFFYKGSDSIKTQIDWENKIHQKLMDRLDYGHVYLEAVFSEFGT